MGQDDLLPEGWDADLSTDHKPGLPPDWMAYHLSYPDDPAELGGEIAALYESKGRVCVTMEEVDGLRKAIAGKTSPLPRVAKEYIDLPKGYAVEFFHKSCPRCGLNLLDQLPDSGSDQPNAEQVKQCATGVNAARIPTDLETTADSLLQGMVDPLSKAEKERAKRNEQRWLAGQQGQSASSRANENRQTGNHQDFVPLVQRKFREWIVHFFSMFKMPKE